MKQRDILVVVVSALLLCGIVLYAVQYYRSSSSPPVQAESIAEILEDQTKGDAEPDSFGTYPGEEYVGQFRNEGRIPVAKTANNKWVVTTTTSGQGECDELKRTLERVCSPFQAMSTQVETATLDTFCSFALNCDKNVVDSGVLYEHISRTEIEPEREMHIVAKVSSWGLDRIDKPERDLDDSYNPEFNGEGSVVYVVDTGINLGHIDFKDRIDTDKNMIKDGNPNANDGNGHGSHCAGTILGNYYGVAKKATLIGVRVLGDDGSGSTGVVASGIAWAANDWKARFKNKGRGGVISVSLGGPADSAMDKVSNAASDAGMIVVVAAGNDNKDACSVSPARTGGKARSNFGVITVVSSDIKDNRSSFSNYGECTDIIAPGSQITSAWKGESNTKNTISGTSMATPHVAGVCAQLLQKHNGDKRKAMTELFTIGAMGKIDKANPGTPNQLLQTPTSGEVTGPIPQPPVPPKIAICAVKNKCMYTTDMNDNKYSLHVIKMSLFGRDVWGPSDLKYPVVFLDEWDPEDKRACGARGAFKGPDVMGEIRTLSGAVVFVERGDCGFYEKVKLMQDRGAAFVVIYQDNNAVPFNPSTDQSGVILIPSGMISRGHKDYMKTAIINNGGYLSINGI